MDDCLFCKIVRGDLPSDTLWEDGDVRVFKDIRPKAPVHYLIVPKKHVESVAALGDADVDIPRVLIFAAKKTGEMLKLEGYKLVFNVGRKGGQVIDHIHLHILGGWNAPSPLDI